MFFLWYKFDKAKLLLKVWVKKSTWKKEGIMPNWLYAFDESQMYAFESSKFCVN